MRAVVPEANRERLLRGRDGGRGRDEQVVRRHGTHPETAVLQPGPDLVHGRVGGRDDELPIGRIRTPATQV